MITPKILQDSENANEAFGVSDDRFLEMWTHLEIEFVKWRNDKCDLNVDTLLEKCISICKNEPELLIMAYTTGAYLAEQKNRLNIITELFT